MKKKIITLLLILVSLFLVIFIVYRERNISDNKIVLFHHLEPQDTVRIQSYLRRYDLATEIDVDSLLINKEDEKEARNIINESSMVPRHSIQFLVNKVIQTDNNVERRTYETNLQVQLIRLSILQQYKSIEDMMVSLSYSQNGREATFGMIIRAPKKIISKESTKRIKDIARSIAPYVDYDNIVVEWRYPDNSFANIW